MAIQVGLALCLFLLHPLESENGPCEYSSGGIQTQRGLVVGTKLGTTISALANPWRSHLGRRGIVRAALNPQAWLLFARSSLAKKFKIKAPYLGILMLPRGKIRFGLRVVPRFHPG